MNINKVSQSIVQQTPDFLEEEYPLFNRFLEYYYQSQEKTGAGQNIINNFLQYLDIDKLDIGILEGKTKIVEAITDKSTKIVVESIEQFLEENGSIMIGDEVIYYENTTSSPNIALSPGISYEQVKLKWTNLATPINDFDGVQTRFPLVSQDNPIAPPSAQHLIVSVYGEVLIPGTDFTLSGDEIVFTTAPRTKLPADDSTTTFITYLNGFIENTIASLDDISNSFGEGKTSFALTENGEKYEPTVDEYVIAIYDGRLLQPRVDFFIDGDKFIFDTAPINGRQLSVYFIEAPIPSFGAGAKAFSRVNDNGELTSIKVDTGGSQYRFEYPPQVSIKSVNGSGGSARSLVNGIKSTSLLQGGKGYSSTNPPIVQIQAPTKPGAVAATMTATVENGSVTALELTSSGSGYTFTPRVTFKQPGGATLGTPTITNGSITGTIPVTNNGFGYATAPEVYVDEPTGTNPIRAALRANISADGLVTSISILNAGQGYTTTPRIAIIDPVGAQVLETRVDGNGRVIGIELLNGGSGYDEIPSVYIVDTRTDAQGNYSGGTGAKAVASIFNGQITDINVTEFGTGYSATQPPKIVIQDPPSAQASVEIGLNEVTGFAVQKSGTEYDKAAFNGCARAASGITSYTETGNAEFSNNTLAAAASVDTEVKCLDALFIKRLLDKYTEQFLPDVPQLDYKKIDVRNAIKSIKDFYSAKGTSFSIAYLFKLLYGETVSISYPKDQIIKPSAATWSVDTILRATLVSGNPVDIRDALITQEADIADSNVQAASALVENYISIKTSDVEIFELVLSEETITGTFTVPYKTRLAEPLNTTDSIITVDSTIGWPERNGEFVIGSGLGKEVIQYKEKSLNQFIECTRSVNGTVEDWDSATEVSSNFTIFLNKGTAQEVVMNIVGIVDAQQTTLTDTGSYYLPGDKLSVSKLGGTGTSSQLTTWLYNVKKLVEVSGITFGGVNDQSATVTCANPHGLLVGDQVTVYGANPIIYNGTFLVTSRDSATVFQYQLPQPATTVPQGNILVSIDLNKGKSDSQIVLNAIGPYTTNIQNTFFNDNYVYVASTGIPNYNIGPFPGSALLPGNQRKLNRFPTTPVTISTKNTIASGPIGTWVNGVSVWSYKSTVTKTFGAVTSIDIPNKGEGYDAANPPVITIDGGGGTGATADVVVDGAISEVTVDSGGTGYTSSPLVSIVGGGGSGASATAIITKGVVSRILINEGGTGYTSQPSITIVGGGGTGATGTASVRGPIKSVNITNGGASYTSNPSVTLSSGSGAVAQAIVNNGRIISIAIISAGSGYTTAPEIQIQGDGFGAVARATIDTDGENAGRVTGITIVNKGIGYTQGQTVINLNSIGQGAQFSAQVFKWTYNLQETSTIDSAKGFVAEGFNNQYGGEYAHISNPQRLRYILGDNLFQNTSGSILEQEDQLVHSPIIGWAFDGNPIYGPYAYTDPTDQGSSITRMRTSYSLKTELVYNVDTNPTPVRTAGPLLSEEAAGNFVEDYQYVFNSGDLDQYNGRFCKTPDFPEGRYCYFVTIDAAEAGNPVFPYVLGPSFNSVVDKWNLSTDAVQQNIPTGVVRYRDPYENVDIDVERAPNASTNALTLENGDVLLFEVEDEDRSGVIEQDELDDPDQVFEESPLQLYDYFPKVKLDSKVDIEVETTTKFEDASVTGFTIENPGTSYQVDDRLIFDNTDTGGSGVSARVSRIKGETVEAYTFESISGQNYGVLTTEEPHNLIVGDTVFVDYSPVMDNTNKQFIVRQYTGIEEIIINQTGSGYNEDIPPTIVIDSDSGTDARLQAVVSSVGSIDTVNILNSGSGYTSNPRVILSHPQVFKKADYYVSFINNNDYVKVNDTFVNENKEVFICGKTKDASANVVAFVAKLSATGVKEWEKTLELGTGQQEAEFLKLVVDGSAVWVVGQNRPNSSILADYNPDIILAKYTQADNGLSATLTFQKGYAGISGSTRGDVVTSLVKYSDTRFLIGGFTNTNSASPEDAFLASIDTSGNFSVKRKFASSNKSEKITDIIVNGEDVYYSLEVADTNTAGDVDVAVGKASIGTSVITSVWIKKYANTLYSTLNSSLCIDEFNEIYVVGNCRLKSDDTNRDSFWVGKINTDGALIWNYRYVAPGREVDMVGNSEIDIFGDLNVAFNRTDNTTGLKTVDTVKIGYDGVVKNHTTNNFDEANIEGITAHSLDVDNSADVHVFGQISWNRNEFIFPFNTGSTTTDTTGHYTLTTESTSGSLDYDGGYAKIYGYQTGQSTWTRGNLKVTGAQLGTKLNGNWTAEMQIFKDTNFTAVSGITQHTLFSIGDATDATGGLWLYYNVADGKLSLVVTNNSTTINAGSAVQSTQTTMFADDTWQFIGLKRNGNTFTVYVNGISVITATLADTNFANKDFLVGQISGRDGTTGTFRVNEQGQYIADNFRLRNRAVDPTTPSDISVLPTAGAIGLSYSYTDLTWFPDYLGRYDYIDYAGFGLKVDKNADAVRLGDKATQTNTGIAFTRTAVTPVTGSSLTISISEYALGDAGLQSLDFDDADTTMTQDSETLTYTQDVWSSRTATVPSPGSQKLKVTAVVKDRYFFKVTNTLKIDNIQKLTINQSFRFTVGSKLVLRNTSGAFINSGYITKVDTTTNHVFVAVNNNTWSNDLNTGRLSTEQFNEQSTYGITGVIPNDINQIDSYSFAEVINTTPGTFDLDLADFNAPADVGGTNNLDEYAVFKPYSDDDYSIRIDEVSGSSPYIVGSVVQIASGNISFNSAYSTAQITGLTGVTKITVIANLTKILQVTARENGDEVYVITDTNHYLDSGDVIFVDGNPSQDVGGVTYDEYDGAFAVNQVISPLEFVYKLNAAAVSDPATTASGVSIFSKSPTLKMYYGHQYLFDLSHSSLEGGNLSFSKDNLYKLEYSFNSIERVGTPGLTGEGQPTPTVKLKVDRNIVTNISYYFDPSRTGDDSPVIPGSYLDVVDSPYVGTFQLSGVAGATITRGADILKFPLLNEPEGPADISQASYSTSSKKAVGSISDIRVVNAGGFYQRLPIVSDIQSTRQIERVQINEPGTEYAVGQYRGVPITGDGEGGLVEITVADGTDSEGDAIPGQIQAITVTSPGKGYTTATIDIDSVDGILGAGLTGSGAEVEVVIPSFGSGASVFTKGDKVGKIKKLKNNNFGYDYPHDYTLRPEITFPINAQLTSTSILTSITVNDPGSGYSQAPAVIISGGGGSGAVAEATIKNGRLDQILIKDPGAGYSSTPSVNLKSSFNYVINLDLGLLQFSFPHGIVNGAEVTVSVTDTGDGAEFPLSSGATGRLNATTTYYAIAGTANSLEDDQLKLAITAANAELGDALTFSNAGTGRQSILTESFGGSATANVGTSTFLEGELVYQGDSLDVATATGYVSTNSGWQVGPRILKIVDYTGDFSANQRITGVISKSSGVISDLKIAKGVLEIGSITETTGQFIDDVGKPSEIIQKIQDSYYYQDFSYAVKSAVSIGEWKEILIKNVHPASFKVFGELNLNEYGFVPNKETFFELTKSVELTQAAIVPNIQNFALVEPVYSEFNNTEVLFRQKRLTSSENILTSVVQRLDDISNLFDGERIAFPLTVDGNNVVANANQLMIVLNGIVQNPGTAFEIQNDSIVFQEPPSPPASVKYVNITINQINTISLTFTNQSGIFPLAGNTLIGTSSAARLIVTSVVGDTVNGFMESGSFIVGELITGSTTGFNANLATNSPVTNLGLFVFGEKITNFDGDTAIVEQINLERGQETPVAKLRYTIGAATTNIEVIDVSAATDSPVPAGTFVVGDNYQVGSEIFLVNSVTDGSESTTIGVTRGQNGTAAAAQQEDAPLYGTAISVTNALTLSKTAGTYQSTPGLFDIQLNDVIIGSQSGVVARVTSTATYQDPTTQEFIGQVNISEGSSFFGLLFNRIASQTYPNVILDDISSSQVNVVQFDDNATAFNSNFPANEQINNYVIPYDNASGDFDADEIIRNYKIDYGNNIGDFQVENGVVRKLTFTDKIGDGFFAAGQIIRTRDTKAEVIGYNSAINTVYLGKIGRSQRNGQDYFQWTWEAGAYINTYNEKFGSSCLALSAGLSDHTFVSGVADGIVAGGGATGTYTAATGTSYNPATGAMTLEIGNHSLTTSNTVTIADNAVTFTCDQDGDTSNKSYPRSTDPASGTALAISAVTSTTITVNVGAVPIDEYISTPSSSEFAFGTSAYTIELWVKPLSASLSGTKTLLDFRTQATDVAGRLYLEAGQVRFNSNNVDVATSGLTTLNNNVWYHIAVVRSSTSSGGTKLYIDGVERGVGIDANNYAAKPLRIGGDYAGANEFAGYIDELRVSTTNRYTTAFTAPTGMFQGDATTKLLLHFDGEEGQTYVEDWSGGESFTADEYFNNDAILATSRSSTGIGVTGFTGNSHRYINAADNIILNKDFIANEAVYIMKNRYPYFTVPGGEINCEDDVRDILDALVNDLRNGSNDKIWDASALYVNRTVNPITLSHVESEIAETLYTLEKTQEIVEYVINNTPWEVQGDHGLTQKFDTSITESSYATATTFTPSGATYDPATGLMVITSNSHGLVAPSSKTATGATYTATTGVLQITSNSHGLSNGDRIKLADNSLTFTCTMDGNTAQKTYPRANDPASQGWLEVSNVATNTFEVNVGKSPTVNYTPTTATYNPATGIAVITLPENNLEVGQNVQIAQNALTFSRGSGSNGSVPTAATTSYEITQNGATSTATAATYDPASGQLVVTVANHGFTTSDKIRIEDNSLTFTCTKDGNFENKTYPRSTDPFSGRWLRPTAVTTNTFTVNVGPSSAADQYVHTFVSATANGIVKKDNTITVDLGTSGDTSAHTFASATTNGVVAGGNYTHTFVSATTNGITVAGDSVFLATESIVFTCTEDGNTEQKSYPRKSDPAAKQVLVITAADTNTFTVNVGASGQNDQYAHTFVSASSGAVTKSEYNLNDCTDVINTVDNLMSIVSDTLDNASQDPAVDHLGSVTKKLPAYKFLGGTVNAFRETPFDISYHDANNDVFYSNRIDTDAQYRFRDAANLIRANRSAIVDKAAYDMLQRYPDLAQDMPRNQGGGSTDGTVRCKTDLGQILDGIADDIESGGNEKTVQAANFYLGNNDILLHIRLQVFQSVYAHERLAFYAKQAITGDLTYDNTDAIIVGDWGITQDAGGCANVKTAIDNLVTVINDVIAPTGNDFHVSADRLYFNRQYLAEEVTGYTRTEFQYDLNGVTYNAFTYADELARQANIEAILLGVISDLQTGGTNSTIAEIEKYLTASLQIKDIEDEILAFVYSLQKLKEIGRFAIRNRVYDFNSGFTNPDYAALYSDENAYRDTETVSDIEKVVYRFEDLIDITIGILAPGGNISRSASKNILYNLNYYKEEIQNQVNSQFGSGAWVYNAFIDRIITDMVHDIVTTDTKVKQTAYKITFTSLTGNFQLGEVIRSSGGGYATVLEWNEETNLLIVGAFTGTAWSASDTLTGRTSSATATVSTVGSVYDWYSEPTNVQTLDHAKTLVSNISGQVSGTNLFTNPEALAINWQVNSNGGVDSLLITDNAISAPDGTLTAEKFFAANNNGGVHDTFRDYNLTAFETFDSSTLTFDTTNESFDTGAVGVSETQTFTSSIFVKAAGSASVRFGIILDDGTTAEQNIFFDLNLSTGAIGSLFIPQGGITGDAYGAVPLGDGWYRLFITATFSFGFSVLRTSIIANSASGAQSWTGNGNTGIYLWGAKLTKFALDPYTATSGKIFYSDNEFNIKNFALDLLDGFIAQALAGTLTSPSPNAGFYSFYSSTAASDYTTDSITALARYATNIIRQQIKTGTYFTSLDVQNAISLPAKTFGERDEVIGLGGGLKTTDFVYGQSSNAYAEVETLNENSGKIVQIYKRFRIDGDITDGPFTMNETVAKQGAPSVTGVVYGFHEDENYKYLDVRVTAGPWAVTDTIVGAENSTTAQISAIENRLHIIDLKGDFTNDIPFKGYTSGETAQPTGFIKNQAAVLSNTGGTLRVDTETLLGTFEKNSVVYPESSRQYIDVIKYDGFDAQIGQRIASTGYVRFGISIISGLNTFTVGNRLYKVVSGNQVSSVYAIITEVDLDNNYIYAVDFQGELTNGDVVGDYGIAGNFPVGYASITTRVVTAGAAAALIQDIKTVGTQKRLYLSDIAGTFSTRDGIKSADNYKSVVSAKEDLKARVKRSSKGFDGTQTNFDLTIENGTSYLPDPAGHLLVFINGILQPPGATNAYTAFSNQIQFTEAPDIGASFTGFYVGKLRQLDDISFEFDSLRQSFNLKRNEVFYSLTLTEGVQSSVIRPENNIIVSLNGVIQEPGIGFEIVGSRIIFSEIPRFGSTFVAFSYVGSEADVDAAEVVPPVEPGDFIRIQGETDDREVAVIESSNSLITFDYLGSVFGQDALAQAQITSGFIDDVQVTGGGSGYTSRPTVRIDSISGFDGNIKALVGVSGVEMSNAGSGYQNPGIDVETSVPDDWTAPNLADYGEEAVDPEIL